MNPVPGEEEDRSPPVEAIDSPAHSGTAAQALVQTAAEFPYDVAAHGAEVDTEKERAAQRAEATPADIPAAGVLESYALHPAAPRLWAWTHALVIGVCLVPGSIAGGVWQGPKALLASALLGVLAWSIASRHLRLAVARFRCERFASGLRYRHGVWWQSEVFIPAARVQHTEVNQGPIARRFGIGKLKVFTAAVQLGALEIDGLSYADALLLRDRLLGRQDEARRVPPPPEPLSGAGDG